jgi:hypothetical protein
MSQTITAGAHVMDAHDNLNPKVARVSEILGNRAKVTWRDGKQSTRTLRNLVLASTELVVQRQKALEAHKRASSTALYGFASREDAEQFALIDALRGYRIEVRDLSHVNRTGKPFQVCVFGVENWECDMLLGAAQERQAA